MVWLLYSPAQFWSRLIQDWGKIACGCCAGWSSDCYIRKIVPLLLNTHRGKMGLWRILLVVMPYSYSPYQPVIRIIAAPVYQGCNPRKRCTVESFTLWNVTSASIYCWKYTTLALIIRFPSADAFVKHYLHAWSHKDVSLKTWRPGWDAPKSCFHAFDATALPLYQRSLISSSSEIEKQFHLCGVTQHVIKPVEGSNCKSEDFIKSTWKIPPRQSSEKSVTKLQTSSGIPDTELFIWACGRCTVETRQWELPLVKTLSSAL